MASWVAFMWPWIEETCQSRVASADISGATSGNWVWGSLVRREKDTLEDSNCPEVLLVTGTATGGGVTSVTGEATGAGAGAGSGVGALETAATAAFSALLASVGFHGRVPNSSLVAAVFCGSSWGG